MYLPRIEYFFFKYRTLEHGILEHSNIRTFEPPNKSTFEFQRTFEHRTFENSNISEQPNIRTFEQPNISEHSNIEHPNIRILANIRTFELSNIWILSNIRTSNISMLKKSEHCRTFEHECSTFGGPWILEARGRLEVRQVNTVLSTFVI